MTPRKPGGGHDGPKCGAAGRTGKPCGREAGWGTGHVGIGACKLHGGSTPAHLVHAQRVQLARSIGELIEEVRPEVSELDPTEGLLEVVAHTWAMRRALEAIVSGLAPRGTPAYVLGLADADDEDRSGVTYVPSEPAGLWGPDQRGEAKPHIAVALLGEWTDRHARACKLAIDAGIEQRRIELAEGQAQQLADVLRAGMAGLLDAIRQLGVVEGPAMRQLEDQVPSLLRSAIERARVIDVTSERTG